MTTKHRPMIHSGFLDLVDLFSHTSFKPNKLTSPVNVDSAVTHTVSGDGAQEGIAQVRQDDKPGEHEEGRRGVAGSSGAENALRAAAGTPMPLDVGREVISVANGAAGTGSGIPAQAVAAGASDPSKDKRRISRVPVPLPPPAPSGPTRPAIHNQVSRGKGNGQAGLRYRKINKRDISYPTHFRHVFHASTYEEAAELLMRWSIEGLDNKMGDPAWVHPLKEVVQARAKEQQALAIAQVVEATAWSKTVGRYTKQKLAPGQLHVVNGLPSSVYSTTNNTLTPRTASALPLAPLSSSLDRVREAEGDESAPAGKQSGYFSSRTAVREKRDGTAQKDHGSGRVEEPSIAELLAQAETPMLIANMPSTMGMGSAAPFRLTGTSVGEIKGSGYPVNPFMPPAVDSSSPQTAGAVAPADDPPPSATTTGPDSAAVEQQAALTTNPVSALAAESNIAPTPRIRPSPPRQPLGARAPPHLKRRVSPIQIKKKALIPAPTESVEQAYMDRSADLGNRDKLKIDADGRVPRDGSTDSGRTETGKSPSSPTFPPFRVIEPSLPTLERAMSIALYFEQYYHGLFKVYPIIGESTTSGNAPASTADMDKAKGDRLDPTGTHLAGRAQRQAELEEQLASMNGVIMSEEEKQQRRRQWQREENRLLRERRRKVDVQAFEMGRVIGHGAFGVVRIAREKSSGGLMAIKQLRKADMLRKSQEGHIKAEKDVLAAAATRSAAAATSSGFGASSWIVKLHYAFQDIDNLYLVLDYMGGGDLLNLLVALDTFSESMTRFYMAEMILSLAETHRLGYIHRDIKPDNFLFTPEGHVRVSDFGLATDLHWAHDTNHYQHQREALLKKHGVDLEYPAPSGTVRKRMRKKDVERIMGKEWVEKGEGVLSWRDRNRRSLAYSVCGTNSYMAPEVIRGQGYGFSCDWWSLGVIMYECLYGYPPFVSNSRHATRQKILNWKTNLKFPPAYQVSKQCVDFMTRLLCEPEDRLGSEGRPVGVGRSSSILGARSASGFFRSADSSAGNGQGGEKGLGSDGVEQIKAHPWFAGIDWHRLHLQPAPYNPALAAEDDTKHFDTDIPDEPLAAPNGMTSDATRDPMLGHSKHGKQLLEIRKELAFKGWTYKSPTAGGDSRYGHMTYLSSGGSSDEGTAGHAEVPLEFGGHCGGEAEEAEMEAERLGLHMPMTGTVMIRGGTVRGRALSL